MNRSNPRIEEALQSLDGLQRAVPRPDLFSDVVKRLDRLNADANVRKISVAAVWLAAASFALLVSLNIGLVVKYKVASEQTTVASLATAYDLAPGSDNYLSYR